MILISFNELFDSYPEKDMLERRRIAANGIIARRFEPKVKYHIIQIPKDRARSDDPGEYDIPENLGLDESYTFIIPLQETDTQHVTVLLNVDDGEYVRFYIDRKTSMFEIDRNDHTKFLRYTDELDRRIIKGLLYTHWSDITYLSRNEHPDDIYVKLNISKMQYFTKKKALRRIPKIRRESAEALFERVSRSFI